MKKVIRLTESDLHGIIRKSVNKILREGGRLLKESEDINSDTEGLRDSLIQYIKNPVDIVRDVDYEPTDDEVIGALNDLDLDTDFSDLMGGQYDESRRMRGRRLTEGRLRRIVKESIKKVLRENELDYVPSASDYEGIEDDDFELDNYNGFYNYDNNGDYVPEFDEYGYDPSIMRDVDPDEISPDDLSVDADIAGVTESRKRLKRIIRESVRKVLSEMPVGKKINFNVDKRPVYKKFSTRARNPKFGLDRSSQRQMGMMYAQAMSEDRDDLAEKIWDYAHQKQEEASRINDEMYDILNNAFFQGEREFNNEDIWYDDDPQFN